jgi:predicted DNA-binding WGR domain protein
VRIYMQTSPSPDAPLRFCHLLLQQDLLGGWTLVREAGRQGGSGRVRREHFATRDEAEAALIRERDQHGRRGFRVVFAEGIAAH